MPVFGVICLVVLHIVPHVHVWRALVVTNWLIANVWLAKICIVLSAKAILNLVKYVHHTLGY